MKVSTCLTRISMCEVSIVRAGLYERAGTSGWELDHLLYGRQRELRKLSY
jgi:hypothetical protein